jgi:FkbM family methyltransferase
MQKKFLKLTKKKIRNNGHYGIKEIFSKYIGLKIVPSYIKGEVPHGWVGVERNLFPGLVAGFDGLDFKIKEKRIYVARSDQENCLRKHKYKDVHAIGHPIIYIPKPNVKRILNSLLIMPKHSLPETTEDWTKSDIAYTNFLKKFINKFNFVCLCIHQTDLKKNNWKRLRNLIPNLVEGASENDINSYYRISELFSIFEYVTSNDFGSHVAYASYFGSKVSIAGPIPTFKKSDYSKLTLFRNSPKLLDVIEDWHKKKLLWKLYKQFVCNPINAKEHKLWASWQLGQQCKKSSKELKKLFYWNAVTLISYYIKIKKIFIFLYSIKFSVLNLFRFFGFKVFLVIKKLEKSKNINGGYITIKINNNNLIIRNSSSDIDVFLQHFGRRELLDINYPLDVKCIIDLGANVGISVSVFKYLFPKAKIVAVEMDNNNFSFLKKNTKMYENVFLIQGAAWSNSDGVNQIDNDDGEWAYRVENLNAKQTSTVKSYTFDDICKISKTESIDVLKIDIEGAESEVFFSSWKSIFSKTKLTIIEIHYTIPNCADTVHNALIEAKKIFNLKVETSGEYTLIYNLNLQ